MLTTYSTGLEGTNKLKDDRFSKHICGFILFGFICQKNDMNQDFITEVITIFFLIM